MVSELGSATLSDGSHAVLREDDLVPGSVLLLVSGVPQSQVLLDRPEELFFEYVQRIGNVIDLVGEPGEPLTAIHLGAGALTLPRYIEATRPGSTQQVLELEPALVELVREHLPLPRRARIRVRYGDARERLAALPHTLDGAVDVVVVDVFAGNRTPAHLTSVEFFGEVAKRLSPRGILAVNVMAGPGLLHAKRQASTVAAVLPHAAMLAEASLLKGQRYGNVVLIASKSPLPIDWLPALTARGPHPGKVVHGAEFVRFAGSAAPVTDATAADSVRGGVLLGN